MSKNAPISLGNHFRHFVQNRINGVVRAGLHLSEEEDSQVNLLKAAIQEGIDSGIANDFDPKAHLASLKAKKQLHGFRLRSS